MVTDMLENPPKAEKNNPRLEEAIKETAAQSYAGTCNM
jgi:hypothetical protein